MNFVVYDRIKWDAREAHMIVAHRFVSRENDPCVFPFAGIEPRGAAADVASSFQPIAAQICPEGFDHRPHQASLDRSEEHTSELQSLMRITYAVFCMKKKIQTL